MHNTACSTTNSSEFYWMNINSIGCFNCFFSPGNVILMVSSSLHAAFPEKLDLPGIFITNLVVVIGYIYICLNYKQETQLKVAKILTFIYSIVMTFAIVGLMIQVCICFTVFREPHRGYKVDYSCQTNVCDHIVRCSWNFGWCIKKICEKFWLSLSTC